MLVAQGPGPKWLRVALVVAAGLYFVALVWHPPQKSILRPIAFFTESTCLFPSADKYALEYRLEGWSCSDSGWHPLDPRAYFPIEADDKESRFQRLGHFYGKNPTVMHALEDYIAAHHADHDDAVLGPIGGIRLFKLERLLPPPGSSVDRYVYRPLAPPEPTQARENLWWNKSAVRRERCEAVR